MRTPDQRLRVFVSSTIHELAEERDAALRAIRAVRLTPVMFESGARPHPAETLYRSYLSQSHIFMGIYWQSYGWIAPDMAISGLEDEYALSSDLPRLVYIKEPSPARDPALQRLLARIEGENATCYKSFAGAAELGELIENDLVLLLAEHFEMGRGTQGAVPEPAAGGISNIPTPRDAFIGREQERERAANLLRRDDVALVTLTGPGGSGKSRLAIHIALDMADCFPDGMCLARLESIMDAGLVPSTVAATLRVAEAAEGEPLLERLSHRLQGKQMLLVLDNFEQVMPAAPWVAELLEGCPGLKVLVTSRAPLRLRAEHELKVPPLAVPPAAGVPDLQQLGEYPAVRLFVERAKARNPYFELNDDVSAAVAGICHRLDGLPLAIELASGRIGTLPPLNLLAKLEHRFDVLRVGARDLPPRQQTLQSAIDWSYNLLDEREKRFFRRLAVFSGGWTLEAAEEVCNADGVMPSGVMDAMESLVANNLLQDPLEVEKVFRFGMLDSIRECAEEHLAAETESIRALHARHFTDLAERLEAEATRGTHDEWHRRIDAEIGNVRAALTWAVESGETEVALRLANALGEYWEARGYWHEGIQWLEQGLMGSEAASDEVRAKALGLAGWLTRALGGRDRGVGFLQESLALWRQIGQEAGIAHALSRLGTAMMHSGGYPAADAMLEEALRLRRELQDQIGACATLLNLAYSKTEQGSNGLAVELYTEALAIAQATADQTHIGKALGGLGEAHMRLGNHTEADAALAAAGSIFRRLGDRTLAAYASGYQGVIALRRADYSPAHDFLVEAVEELVSVGHAPFAAQFMANLAALAEAQRRDERAARLLGASEALRQRGGGDRSPDDRTTYEAVSTAVHGRLGAEAFSRAWAEGTAMETAQAVAYARADHEPYPSTPS